MTALRRAPASARHAFALAFDLAIRRDPVQSLVVPFVLRAPWLATAALLPPIDEARAPLMVALLALVASLGDFVVQLVVGSMLRFRARSVYGAPEGAAPAPAGECYTRGVRRVPWLAVTEIARNVLIGFVSAFSLVPLVFLDWTDGPPPLTSILVAVAFGALLLLPAVFVGYRLALATESIVLRTPHTWDAFADSWRLTARRFFGWLEMLVATFGLMFVAIVLAGLASVAVPNLGTHERAAVLLLVAYAILPVVQYAWTFFYLGLVEQEHPAVEAAPAYASAGTPAWPTRAPAERPAGEPRDPVAPHPGDPAGLWPGSEEPVWRPPGPDDPAAPGPRT